MDLKTLWFSAEELTLKFIQKDWLTSFIKLLKKVTYTVILFVLCLAVFTALIIHSCYQLIVERINKEPEPEPMEHEPMPYKVEGTKTANDSEPEIVKRLRDAGH